MVIDQPDKQGLEEEIKHPGTYESTKQRGMSADCSDQIIVIKGQDHHIRPMSQRSFRKWSRNHSSSLSMPRLSENDSSVDDQDSWKEISQMVQSSN